MIPSGANKIFPIEWYSKIVKGLAIAPAFFVTIRLRANYTE